MRRWPVVAALLALGCAARRPPQESSLPRLRTPLDGVYSEAQSRRGEAIFFASCVKCHRAEMTGSQIVPPLRGPVFVAHWSRRTAGDLFEWVRVSMPPGQDNKLSPQEYADVLAYVFSRNEFPAGPADLPADFATLRTIRIAPEPMENDGGTGTAIRP